MIRTLALAAAAAAVGYTLGQRAAESPESRFSRPEVTGDDVVVEDGEIGLSDDTREYCSSHIGDPYREFDDGDEVIGR